MTARLARGRNRTATEKTETKIQPAPLVKPSLSPQIHRNNRSRQHRSRQKLAGKRMKVIKEFQEEPKMAFLFRLGNGEKLFVGLKKSFESTKKY